MDPAKITLSEHELALLKNADWLLTKNSIISKVSSLFGQLADEVALAREALPVPLPESVWLAHAKISRGENYKGLPYIILDYPRRFSAKDIFALRTMFWWGNFISITLHVSGSYKTLFLPALKKNIGNLAAVDFCIGIDDDEWRHDFGTDNYRKLSRTDQLLNEQLLTAKAHTKLAVQLPLNELSEWNTTKQKITAYYKLIFASLQISFPTDEKDLSPGNPITGSGL